MASKRPRNEISIAEDLLRYQVTSTTSERESDLVNAKERADKAMSRLRRSLEAKNLPAMHDKPTYDAKNNRVFNYLDVPKADIDLLASSSDANKSTQQYLDELYSGAKAGGEIKDGGDDNVGNDDPPDSSTSTLKHLKYNVAASDLNASHKKDLGLALKDEASVLDNAFTQSTGSGFQVDFYVSQEAYQDYYNAAKDAYLAKNASADLADESVQIKINKAASKNFIHDRFANTLKLQRKFRSAETREAKKAAKEKQEEQRKKLEKKYIDAQAKESSQREKLSAKQKAEREKKLQQFRKFAAISHLDLEKLPEANMEGLSENQIEARKNSLIGILGSEKGKDGIPFADVLAPYNDVLSKDQQLSLLEQLKADRYVDPEAQRRARVFAAQNGIRLDKADKFGKRTSNNIANSYFDKTGFEASDSYIEDVKQQRIKKLSEKRFKTGKYKGQLLGDILAPYTDGMSTDEQLYTLSKFKGNDRQKFTGNIAGGLGKGALAVGGFGLAAFGKGLSGITKAINNGWRTFKSLTSKVLGTVGIIAALSTQAVSLLRRGVLNVVNNAKETVASFKTARELGIPLWRVQQMNDADVRRGLEKGTSTKAVAKINEIGADVLNIDEGALGKLAPVAKGTIESLILSKKPYEAMEELINAYYNLGSGKNGTYYDTVGNPTTKLNSQEVLVSNLRRVSPEMADLLSTLFQMNEAPSMYGLAKVTGLADYYRVNSPVEIGKNGIANRADLSVTLQYNDFIASFKELLSEFKTNFAKEVASLIDSLKVASAAVLGKPSEVINTVKAVKETNVKTIDAANYAQAVFAHGFQRALAGTPELAGLSTEKAQQLAIAAVNADGTSITPTQYAKFAAAKEILYQQLESKRSKLKDKAEKGKLKLSDLFTFDGKGKPTIKFLASAKDSYEASADDALNLKLRTALELPMFKDLAKYKNMSLDEFFEYAGDYNTFAYAFSTDSNLRNASISFAVADTMLQQARKTDKAGGTLGTEDTYRQELLEQITKKLEETKYTYTTTEGTEYSSNNIATIYRAADADLKNNANDERAKKTRQFATNELINAESLFNFAHITDYLAFDKNGNLSFMDLGKEEVSGKVRTTAENEKFLLGVNKKLGLVKQAKANKLTDTETEELQQKLHNIAEFLNQWNAVDEKEGADIAWNNFAKAVYTTDEKARNDAISAFAKFSGIDKELASRMVEYANTSSGLGSNYDSIMRNITEASAYGASEVLGTNEVPKTFFGKVFNAVQNFILQKPLSEITTAVQRYNNAGGDSSSTLDSILKSLLLPHLNKEDVVQAAKEQGVANPEDFYNSGAFLDYISIEQDKANNTVNFYLDLNINDTYKGRLMYKDFLPDSRNSAELSLNMNSQGNLIDNMTEAQRFSYLG